MFQEETEAILKRLLAQLQSALGNHKAKHAAIETRNAYMIAAREFRELERAKQRHIQIRGSAHDHT